MSFKNMLKYSLVKTIRYRKNIYFILILIICTLILLGTFTYRNYLLSDIKNLESKVSFRTLSVLPSYKELEEHGIDHDYEFEKSLEINHVLEEYPYPYDIYSTFSPTFKNEIYTGDLTLVYGSENTLPNNIIGETFTKDATGVAICPEHFLPSIYDENFVGKENIFLDGNKLIGQTFTTSNLVYKSDEIIYKDFKIIGVYDAIASGYNANYCFVSGQDIAKLYEATRSKLNTNNLDAHLVVVDDMKNIDNVIKELGKIGFEATPYGIINDELLSKINIICLVITIIMIGSVLILSIFYTKKKLLYMSNEIGMLKVLGYKNYKIKLISVMQIFWISFMAFVLGIVIFELIFLIIHAMFYNYFIYNFNILTHYLYAYLIALIIIFVLPQLVNYILISLKLKKDIILLIKGES